MGWLYPYHTFERSDLIKDLTKGWESENATGTCIAKCTRGNILWAVWEVCVKDTGNADRYIVCNLMQKYNTWGYKDIDESMHPYYYTCPLKYLAMVPKVLSEDWRSGVVAYHERRKQVRTFAQEKNGNT